MPVFHFGGRRRLDLGRSSRTFVSASKSTRGPVIPPTLKRVTVHLSTIWSDGRQRALRRSEFHLAGDFPTVSRPTVVRRPPGWSSPVARPSEVAFPPGDESWTPEMFRRRPSVTTHVATRVRRSSVSRQPRRRSRSRRREDRHPLHMAASKELRRRRPPAKGPKYGKNISKTSSSAVLAAV